jgi:hypothetical protein
MVISELLPNPKGKDAQGEWIELRNDSNVAASLRGWSLQDASGKKFAFKDETLRAGAFRIIKYSESKLSLNNANEKLILKDAQGNIVDTFSYKESVPDDIALMRGPDGAIVRTFHPTPGSANEYVPPPASSPNAFSRAQDVQEPIQEPVEEVSVGSSSTVLREASSPASAIAAGVLVSLILAAIFMHFFKRVMNGDFDNPSPRVSGKAGEEEE